MKRLKRKNKVVPDPSRIPRKIHLRTVEDVRRLLSLTINELRQGKIAHAIAGRIFYGAQVLLSVFEHGKIDERIQALEERAKYNGDY